MPLESLLRVIIDTMEDKLELASIKPPGAGKQCFANRLNRQRPFSIGFVPVHPSTLCQNLVEISQAVLMRVPTNKKKQAQPKTIPFRAVIIKLVKQCQ